MSVSATTCGSDIRGEFSCMDEFYHRVLLRAATVDELLSDAFEVVPAQKGDTELAARRLAAWCRACTNGDWLLFERRLERDRLSISQVLTKFSSVRLGQTVPLPQWITDAIWIEQAFQQPTDAAEPVQSEPCAFEHLFVPVIREAVGRFRTSIDGRAFDNLSDSADACLRMTLLRELSSLSAPAIYECFNKQRKAEQLAGYVAPSPKDEVTTFYDRFIADMKAAGLRRLFEEKPVLLRLIATIVRQWIDTSCELVIRLGTDSPAIRQEQL